MAWLLGDKLLALVLGLAIFGMLARQLGPERSGHFAYAAAMLQVGLGLSLVCAGVALLPRFCRIGQALPGAIANVFALRVLSSLGAMAVAMAYAVLAIDEPQRRLITLIMLMAIPLIEPFYILATYWLSRNENRPTVIARSCGLLARAGLVMLGLYFGAQLWVLASAWVLESFLNASIQTFQARRRVAALQDWRRFVTRKRMLGYLQFGIRFAPALWLSQLFLRLDRLILAQWLPAEEFGLYAAPMQLIEVWVQVAYLIGSSLATAVLYPQLRRRGAVRAVAAAGSAMAAVGVTGLLGAWLIGPFVLQRVYGASFGASAPILFWGAAAAVLLFADQVIDMLVTARNQAGWLIVKWAAAVVVAASALALGFGSLRELAGPAAIAAGVLGGWIALGAGQWLSHGRLEKSSTRAPKDSSRER